MVRTLFAFQRACLGQVNAEHEGREGKTKGSTKEGEKKKSAWSRLANPIVVGIPVASPVLWLIRIRMSLSLVFLRVDEFALDEQRAISVMRFFRWGR